MAELQMVGKPCPKCSYVRTPEDSNPAWQCPRCHIAYAKFLAAAAPISARLAAEGREMAERAGHDSSLALLIATNVLVLGIAYLTKMNLLGLMLVYWIQSVIIGVMNVYRILRLDEFSTEGWHTEDGEEMTEEPSTQRSMAMFFVLHYGGWHAGLLVMLLSLDEGRLGAPSGYVLCALAFLVSHWFSLRHNLASDARGRPHIGMLTFLPYARIVPMQFILVFGAIAQAEVGGFGPGWLLTFGALKTVADAVMHTVGHHIMSKASQHK